MADRFVGIGMILLGAMIGLPSAAYLFRHEDLSKLRKFDFSVLTADGAALMIAGFAAMGIFQ